MADPTNVENNNTAEPLDMSNGLDIPVGGDNAPASIETPFTVDSSNTPNMPGVVNFDTPYPDLSGYDPVLFEDSVDIGIQDQGMPNLEMNQPFFDMIDRAAVNLNKYPVLFSNNDMNDRFPGRAGTDFDPFRTSSGIPDLSTSNGIKAYLSNAVEFSKQVKGPNKTKGYKDPFYYSARRYELDRYYRHPRFADLGFHPFANNDAYYQANSSKWDNFTRSRGAWADTYGPAFTSSWRSIGDMFTGDITQSDMQGAQAMDDAMRRGRSSSGGTRGFFNDLFVNSSYTVGILSSIAVEEIALWGMVALQGGMNPASDALAVARTADNAVTSANALRRMFSMKAWKAGGTKMLQKIGQIDNARTFWRATRSGGKALGNGLGRMFGPETLYQLKHIRTSAKAGDNMTQMAKANRLFGGFYRDVRAVNLAWAESKMEGGLVEMEMQDELYQEIYNLKDGVDPTIAEMEMLVSDSRAAALTTQLINLPIIFLSNKLVLDGALRGFKPLGRMADESLSGPLGRILFKQGAKKGTEAFTDVGRKWIIGDNMRRMWKAGFKGSLKHTGATALRYTAANFAEGIQELSQEATANGVKTYFKSLYDTPMGIDADMKLAEMTDQYTNARKSWLGDYDFTDRTPGISIINAAEKGAKSQMGAQGLHTFMSGFLMGGMIQGPQRFLMETTPNIIRYGKDKVMGTTEFADYRAKENDMITNAVESLNKIYENPEQYFDIKKLNLMTQKELNTGMFEAAGADDITSFMDMKDHSIFQHLYTVMATGQMGNFREQMKSFEKLDDIDIKEAFESVSSTPNKIRGRVGDMLKRMDDVEEGYRKLDDEYINPYKPKAFKKGTRKYHEEALRAMAFEHAKMMAMFTQDTFKQSLIRANSVMETLSSDPVLASISASDISALTSRQGLAKEIALLKKELDFSSSTPEEKVIRDKKKKKLELLENYEKIFNAEENQAFSNGQMFFDQFTQDGKTYQTKEGRNIGFYDKRKMGKLKPAFVAYLQFLSESNDDFIVSEKIEETLKKIVDHGYLKGRAADFHKAASVLMDKNTLYEMTDRLSVIMKSVWEEHKDKNNLTKRVKKHVDQAKRLTFLKELGEKGIQPDADQTKLFLEDGTIPYDYFDEQGKVTKSSDPAAWMIVEGLQENYRLATKVEVAESTDQTTTERQNTESVDSEEVTETKEPNFESVIGRSKYQAFYMQDKGTQEIINTLYEEYKKDWTSEDGVFLNKNKWAVSESGGKNIIKSRYELNELYNSQSEDVTEKFPTLDDWIIGNQRNPLIVGTNGILNKNGITISDVSTELVKEEGVKKDKLSSNEKVISTDKTSGLSVIETTIYDDNNKPEVFYTIVDSNTKNAVDKYKSLDPKGKAIRRSYTTKADALTALKFIQNNMPQSGTFKFAGKEFSTTDIVVDSAGNEWMVRSSPNMMRNNKNLYVVPVNKAKAKKGKDDRKYLTEDRWRKEGWTKKGDEKVDLTSSLTTKLTSYEPIKIYPFDGSKVEEGYVLHDQYPAPEDVDQQFQKNLKSLTEKERKNLTLIVERNPFYDKFKKDLEAGRLKAKLPNDTYSVNESILQGQNEFEVTIMSGNKPIGKLMGLGTSILLDVDGTTIIGSKITAEQAQRLFLIPYGQNADEAAALIRRNYTKAELITSELLEKLGKNQSIKINISKLDNIELNVTPGYTGYKVDNNGEPTLKNSGKNASTPWSDLEGATYDGEIIIFDTRRSRANGRRSSRRVWSIDPFSTEGKKVDAEILESLQGRGFNSIEDLNMGRYVQVIKHPNGSLSFVELKLDRLSSEAVSDVAQNIKNKQQEILEKNFKDGKYIDSPGSKDLVRRINEELNESFYMLSNTVGDDMSIFFNEFGQLIFKVQREISTLAEGITRTIALDNDVMAGVTDAKTFVETLNANWIANEKGEKSLNKKTTKGAFLPLNITVTTDSFTPNLPLNVQNAETIIEAGVSARVIPSIVWGQLADLNYTNNANIQKDLNGFNINETQVEETSVVVEEKTTVDKVRELNQQREQEITDYYTPEEGTVEEGGQVSDPAWISMRDQVVNNKRLSPTERNYLLKYLEAITKLGLSHEQMVNKFNERLRADPKYAHVKDIVYMSTKIDFINEKYDKLIAEEVGVEAVDEDVLTDEVFQELMADEFKNIPEEIINGIKRKVIENKEFTPQEQIIVDAYEEMNGKNIMSSKELSDAKAAIQKDEDGNISESDNPNVIDQILAKKEEIEKKKVSLENEYRAEIKKANPAISTGKLNLQVENMLEVDDQIKKLKSELAKLQSNIGYKIVNEFDSRDVEDIDTFIEWAQKNLPDFINIQDIDGLARRLKANGVTLGAFLMSLKNVSGGIESLKGTIYTGKQNPYKYHESFHAVFRMLMPEEDIQKYLNIAKKDVLKQMRTAEGYEILPGTFVKTMEQARVILKGLSKSYAVLDNKTLNERVLEEYIADEFEKFKTNPKSSKVQSEVKSLFTRILEWIKNIFIAPNYLEYNALFTSIDSGQYKNAAIQENRFTLSAMEGSTNTLETGAPSNLALKAIRKGDPIATTRPAIVDGKVIPDGRTIFINNYFTKSETDGIIAQIGALYIDKIDDLSKDPNFKGEYNPSSILEEVVNSYIEDYNPARSSINADGNETFFYADRENWSSFKDRLKERYKSLKEYKSDVISSVDDYLTLFDINSTVESEILEKTDMSADGSVKTTEEYEASANEIGGFKSLSKANRKFIATTTKQVKDEFTGDIISVPVDYVTAYNALMKSLSGITNTQIMLIKLKLFEQSNPDASAVINAIFDKVNLSNVSLEDFIEGNYNLNQITNASFFQSIIKGFSQFRSDYLYIETDTEKGLVNIFKANHRDDASSQTDVWQENYTSKLEKLNNDPAFVTSAQAPWDSIIFNSGKKRISEKQLDKASRNIANEIFNTIGIDMSYLAIKYLILSNGVSNKTKAQSVFVSTFDNDLLEFNTDDISEMSTAISTHGLTKNGLQKGNLFYDMNEESIEVNEGDVNIESTDVKSKIKKLAQVNAIFDSNVGATVFRNPEGKLIYAHQSPTYNLEKIAELNSENAIDNLMSNDGFLESNYLLNNDKFRQLAIEGKLRISRVAGQKLVELSTDDLGNFKSSNGINLDKKATSFGSSTPKDFISQMMNLYLSNYNSLNGKVEETMYDTTDDYGIKIVRPFTTSLVNITVIAESNTADFLPVPIVFAVEMNDGKSKLTDEYVDNIETEIENEFNRIDREVNQKEGYTEDDLKGYNDFDPQDINDEDVKVDRAAKFFKTNELLKNKTQSTVALRTVGEEINITGGPLEIESLATGTSIFLRDGKVLSKLGLNQGETVLSPIYTLKGAVPTTEIYAVTYRGVQSAETYDLNAIKRILGNDISEIKNAKNKYRVDFGAETFHVRTTRQRDWLNGKSDFGVIEIVPQSEIETVDTTTVETSFKILNKEFTTEDSLFPTATNKQLGEEMRALYDSGVPVKLAINKIDPNNISLGSPIQDADVGMVAFSLSVEGNNIGSLVVNYKTNEIVNVEILPEFRGLGLGTKLYKAAAEELVGLKSDPSFLSNKAENIWKSLVKQGLAVKTNVKAKGTNAGYAMIDSGTVPVITDNSIIDALQKAARGGEETYTQAKKRIEEETGVNIRDLVKSRLMEEFEEFNTIIGPGQTQAINQVDRRLLTKLETAEGKTNKNTNNSMDLLNLKNNNPDNHNLKQIFFSDYLNRLSIKQVLLGDASRGLKDAVDEIKRAKALGTAAGPNASSIVASPNKYDNEGNIIGGHGVEHPVKHISLVTTTDVETPAKYGRTGNNDKPVTETDAQMWITTKAFRYMMFGFGSLSSAQARILDRIELGEDISIDEFYGSGISKQGYKELGAILNSKKLVYADGEVFLKMSAFVLTKQLSSDPQTNFETALPGREDMHNLRMKLEQIESRGDETIAIAAPESASKMIKKNIISYERAFDSNTELDAKDVTDLDARWMRLQQISPSNKGTIIDPTQIKQLITSEQDDSIMVTIGGKKMPVGDVRKLYNKAIGDRVEIKYLNRRNLLFDFEKGQDELQESIKAGEVTVDLQAFLGYAQESLSTAGARAQFLELFEVDKTGSPKFDLNNPITITKFQELFMSFFSNGVMSEKVNGDAIALVSGQGMKVIKKVIALDETTGQPSRWEVIRMDDYKNLKNRPEIEFNDWDDKINKTFLTGKNGIKVDDIYVDELRANVRDYDKDGNPLETVHSEFMLPAYHPALKNIKPGDPIPEVIAKAFATRIPSQDKHSAINLKLVDFMPVFYGSSGVFPADLIEISGADFDIDKVYTQFKEFYMKDGKFVEYGATENINQQYEEYLEYTIKESKQKGTSVNMAVKMWNTRGNVIDPILDNDVTLPSEQIIGALRILDMPVTIEEFKEYKKKHDNRLPYTAAQSNIALDAKYVLLGNEGMTKGRNGRKIGIANEPAVLDPLDDVWKFIQSELPELAEQVSEKGVIIDNLVGMFKAWKNNKEGANSIGAIVQPNIVFNLLKEYEIDLRQVNNKGFKIKGGNIELNGYKYKSFKGDYAIDPKTGKPLTQGTRKQFAISALITAATDNAKERLLAKLGLNKDALAVVGTLVSVGVDILTAILLVNQPDIKNMYALAANKNKETDPGIAGLLVEEIFQLEESDITVKTNSKKIDVTTELLMKHIRGEEIEAYERYAILNQFAEARELKTYAGNLQALVTKVAGLDRGMQEMYESFERIDKLGAEMGTAEFSRNIKIPFDSRKLFKGKSLQARYYKVFKNIQQLTPSVFVTETLQFKKVLSSIASNIDSKSRTPERINKINKDILSYIIGKAYTKYLNNTGRALLTESLQNGMIYDEFAGDGLTINKVVNNIRTYMKDKGGNDFINNFIFNKTTKNPNNKSGVNQATMNTWNRVSPNQVTGLQNSLRDLYAEEAIRADVIHMIHYLLVKDGLQYSQGSFLSIIPAPMLDEILTVTKSVNDVFNNQKISKQQYRDLFGIDFNEMINEITEGYLSSRSNIYFLPEVKTTRFGVQKYVKGFEGKKEASKPIIYDEDSGILEMRYYKERGKKKITKKGKHKETPKGTTFEKSLRGTGVEVQEEKINGKTVKVIVFPLVRRMNVGTKRKPDHRTFILDEVYSSKKIEKSEMSDPSYTPQMINYDQDFGVITGHRGVYKEFKTLGSMQTNAMGFLYGPRSTYDYLQGEMEKNDAAINDGTQDSIFDKIAGQDQKPPSIVGPGTNASIVATNNSVKVVETNTDNQEVPVSLSKLEKMSKEGKEEDDFVMPNVMIPEGKGVTFTKDMAIGKETKEPGQNKKLENWYNDLTKIQKSMLARTFKEGGSDISTVEELINDFNDSKILFNEDDYMEQLKKCYTN